MTVTHGSDVESLLALAEHLTLHAELVLVIGEAVRRDTAALRWHGPDAERARAHWAEVEAVVLRPTARAVLGAAESVLQQADRQLAASAPDAGVTAPDAAAPPSVAHAAPGGPGPGTGDGLRERLATLRAVATQAPEVATMATARAAWTNGLDVGTYPTAARVLDEGSAITRVGGRVLTGAGAVGDGVDVVQGVRDGDAARVASGAGGLAIAAAGAAGARLAGPAGVAWTAGGLLGDAANRGMEGSRYGEIVRDMSEGAFAENGAWGIAQVPGILGLAGWERAREAWADDD
jgi:hypothetical protein